MECAISGHRGDRQVFKCRILYLKDGRRIEGCMACTDGYTTEMYPAQKRDIMIPSTGQSYKMSAAHRRDIKMRRAAPDLSHVWKDRRGHGSGVRLTESREYRGAPTGIRDTSVTPSGVRDRRE